MREKNSSEPARHFVMQMQIFLCFWPYKESISKEMNNDDLNLHSMTKCRAGSLLHSHTGKETYENNQLTFWASRAFCESFSS